MSICFSGHFKSVTRACGSLHWEDSIRTTVCHFTSVDQLTGLGCHGIVRCIQHKTSFLWQPSGSWWAPAVLPGLLILAALPFPCDPSMKKAADSSQIWQKPTGFLYSHMAPDTLLMHRTHCSFPGVGSLNPPAGVPFPRILGIEAAGIVEEAPGGEFKKGDVVATAMGGMGRQFDGGYAQYTSVPAAHVQVSPLESSVLQWSGEYLRPCSPGVV